MDQNKLLSAMWHLYWFKDQMGGENYQDFLKTLQILADELDFTGVSAGIGELLVKQSSK